VTYSAARALRVVPAGLYVCAVENQDDTVVPTVAEFDDAYPVVLPVGRSYVDMHDGPEFADDDAEDGADADKEDADGADTADATSGGNDFRQRKMVLEGTIHSHPYSGKDVQVDSITCGNAGTPNGVANTTQSNCEIIPLNAGNYNVKRNGGACAGGSRSG